MQTEFQKQIEAFHERLDKEWLRKNSPVPDVLYHYTDAMGLVGILENKNIRMTHANYLNDSSELQHGWSISAELMKSKIDQHNDNKDIQKLLEFLINHGNPLEKYVEVFVASLCKEGDLLNQWRGYGSSDGAFSIGIKTQDLTFRNYICMVEYSESEQEKYIENFLDEWIGLIKKHQIKIFPPEGEDIIKTLACFYSRISRALIYFKNDAFKSEQEWRVNTEFFNDNPEMYKRSHFREASGIIVPYHELPLNYDTDTRIPLDSVTYALAKDPNLTKKSIELLLLKHGYDLDVVKINESKVPLRFK